MDIPKAKFISNNQTELERLVHTAKQVWSEFYIRKGFKILPYLKQHDVATVYFPNLGFEKIENIENTLSKIILNFPIKVPEEISKKINLAKSRLDYKKFDSQWKDVEKDFWNFISILFPEVYSKIARIEVRITNYGTISSYQFIKKANQQKIIYYIRKDASISHLAEAILTSITNSYNKNYENNWRENEYLVDFLLRHSSIHKLFPKFKETIITIDKKKNQRLDDDSCLFIQQLGIKTRKRLLLLGTKMFFNGREIAKLLTNKEYKILYFMLKNGRNFASIDNISEIIWNNNDSAFSLQALNKIMQRLRLKLIKLGANKDMVKTIRKEGYLLIN